MKKQTPEPDSHRAQRAARALIRAMRRKGTEFRRCQDDTVDIHGPPLPLVLIHVVADLIDEIRTELRTTGPVFPQRATGLTCPKCQTPLELSGFNPGEGAPWRLWECPTWAEEAIL